MEVGLHAAVALATGAVALLVLAANPRRNWNQWLGFFLLLVCANFSLVGAGKWLELQVASGTMAVQEAERVGLLLLRLGYVVQAADPAALAYFASVFPRRTGLASARSGPVLTWAPAVLFIVAEVFGRALSAGLRSDPLAVVVWAAYLSAFYAYACARLLLSLLEERSGVMARQVATVALGVLVAMLPRIALSLWQLLPLRAWGGGAVAGVAFDTGLRLLLLWAGLGAALLLVRHHDAAPERRATARRTLRLVAVACVAFSVLWVAAGTVQAASAAGLWAGLDAARPGGLLQSGLPFTIRWLVFAAAVVVGVVRYEVLSVRSAALADVGVLAAAGAVFVLAASGGQVLGPWASGALAALALLGTVGVVRRRSSASRAGDPRALEVYAALLAAEYASPTSRAKDDRWARVRSSLGISAEEHERLLAAAQAEEQGRASLLLGRFQVVRRLGTGGTATASLVREADTGELVVVKQYHADWLGQAGVRDAARREVEVASRVSHPHLLAVHDLVEADGTLHLISEYAEGGSLRDLLRARGRLGPAEVATLARQALSGLEALHDAGVVHGDLKPENVLLDRAGRAKLADFGAARASPGRRTIAHGDFHGSAAGTLLYMAPEQLEGGPATPATDVYALGAVLYEAMTGRAYAAERPWNQGPRGSPALPPEWERTLRRALAPDPSDRYASASEMLAAIRRCERRAAHPFPSR